ncbi:mucin-like protein [Ptychodera flava]|uniref:mucin-like protein n=1 Tax=Ptychodera flava TaxID=63121 RepID=UPI00396A0D94
MYEQTFTATNGAGFQCAYRSDGSLITGYGTNVFASSFQERTQYPFRGWDAGDYQGTSAYLKWLGDDILPRYYCCEASEDEAFCDKYKEKRPADSCGDYIAPTTGWCVGDPHLDTLDGVRYTFNGLGEYTLVDVDNGKFKLQGRTEQALYSNLTETLATIFSGFAAKQDDSNTIELRSNVNNTEHIVLVDGQKLDASLLSEDPYDTGLTNVKLTKVKDASNESRIVAIFSSGISVSVGFEENFVQYVMDFILSVPQSYKGMTKGLLGVWNDDTSDDFTMADGQLLQPAVIGGNITEEDQFRFGQTWMVTNETSIFTYAETETWSSINRPGFTPFFYDELVTRYTNRDPDYLNTARLVCGGDKECLYDALATRTLGIAMATKTASEEFTETDNQLDNFPPVISGTTVLETKVGDPVTLQYTATDANGDTVTFSLEKSPTGATIDPSTGLLQWTPSSLNNMGLEVEASDGTASSVLVVEVRICNCQNSGTCNYNTSVDGADVNNDKYKIVTCDCPAGYSGDFCENDFNACLDSPCFPSVTCTDQPAPSTTADCGDCPTGLEGDGFQCYDVDECQLGRDLDPGLLFCEQNCANTDGSYTCSCDDGYSLVTRTACQDIDECVQSLDTCPEHSTCTNNIGSYTCPCDSGYKLNVEDNTCVNIDECVEEGQYPCPTNSICQDTDGGYTCTCATGYEAVGNECQDIDECTSTLHPHNCDANAPAHCVNTVGAFDCVCDTGYEGDGVTCSNIDECGDLNYNDCDPQRATCTDTVGSYQCACVAGYTGDGKINQCEDVDECSNGEETCSDVGGECLNTVGSYQCRCATGYQDVSGDGRNCTDINECAASPGPCQLNAACTNTQGSYTCACNSGYEENVNGLCQDVDECLGEHDCTLDYNICVNNDGGFLCECDVGYEYSDSTRTTCVDINECNNNNGDCDHTCNNIIGGHYCECNDGYVLNVDGLSCDDIDECAMDLSTCPQLCVNTMTTASTPDGYTCACSPGFNDTQGDGRVCAASRSCPNGETCDHGTCYVESNVNKCMCDPGYELNTAPGTFGCIAVNECVQETDGCEQVCIDRTPFYRCECNSGYRLEADERTCSDIDECRENLHDCESYEICNNLMGSFECVCRVGFHTDGSGCEGLSCPDDHCYNGGTCVGSINEGLSCECPEGFQGDRCGDVVEDDDGSTDLLVILASTLSALAFILIIGILVCVICCCGAAARAGKASSSRTTDDSYAVRYLTYESSSDKDYFDTISTDSDERLNELARAMKYAPRIEEDGVYNDVFYSQSSVGRQFVRPYIADGTEERERSLRLARMAPSPTGYTNERGRSSRRSRERSYVYYQ